MKHCKLAATGIALSLAAVMAALPAFANSLSGTVGNWDADKKLLTLTNGEAIYLRAKDLAIPKTLTPGDKVTVVFQGGEGAYDLITAVQIDEDQ